MRNEINVDRLIAVQPGIRVSAMRGTMDSLHIFPAYQPLPFPLPVWLMQTLLVAGFYLHALPMNVILGGGFVCAALFWLGRRSKDSYAFRSAKALAISLPLFISFAITQGIVPLLFLQLLYGPAFYTSSIIMAAPWLALVLVVLLSYYISYLVVYRVLHKEHSRKTAVRASALLLAMSVGFALVGYMFSNNMTLMLTPEKWLAMYRANANGINLNTSEAQLLPRYIHFFLASLAVAGMTLGCFGLYLLRREAGFGRWLIKTGSRIYLATTLVQIPVGLWFMRAIPPRFAACFLGGDRLATAVFALSMALMLMAVTATAISSSSGSKAAFLSGLASNALLLMGMIVSRHQLRLFYLNPYIRPESVQVSTQWDLLAVFLLSAVALIGYLIWLSRVVWSGYHPQAADAANCAK